ncbi:hypothetical protein Tco_0745865 [Tanacetum coccineum]
MHDDLEYVKSLEKEIDELESEKADFSNIYDLLSNDVCLKRCSNVRILHSLSDKMLILNYNACIFIKIKEEKKSNSKEQNEKQPRTWPINELKETHRNCKGKSVETQFDKPSVVRQPNAQRIPKPSVLGKPTPFSNSPEMRSFQTKQSVNKTNVSDGSNDMVHNYYLEKAKKSAQLQKDKDVNGKPSGQPRVEFSDSLSKVVPTGKLLNSYTGKVENEPTHGSNVDIPHIHACKQTLGLSAETWFQQKIEHIKWLVPREITHQACPHPQCSKMFDSQQIKPRSSNGNRRLTEPQFNPRSSSNDF